MKPKWRFFLKKVVFLIAALFFSQFVSADRKDLPEYCSLQGGLEANGVILLRTSGNPDLDRSVALELTHLADSFSILPGFGFYDDNDGANAFAIAETVIPDTYGTVIFGKQLLFNELTKHTWGGLAIAGIMAHEFAHIYQYQTEFYELLSQAQESHKLLELHADYLAGYYLGLKRLRNGDIDVKPFLDSLYLGGDTDFTSATHHGTPSERKHIMLEGYKMGLSNNRNIHQVAQIGMELVTTAKPEGLSYE